MFDFLFRSASSLPIRLVPVDLGTRKILVPVAEIEGNQPGKTLLVTGGMDGDEYAGMEAAYRLVQRYAPGDFAGKLLVIPIVNVPGFEAECSQNPLDGRFPKMVFPGSKHGKPTERLVHWLLERYAYRADAWFDLHGGAITEGVRPFVWAFESGVPEADLLAQRYYLASGADTVLFERVGRGTKAGELARRGCAYVLVESGSRGNRDSTDVDRHVEWVEAMMRQSAMIRGETAQCRPERLLRHAKFVYAPFAGLWRPAPFSPDDIVRGMTLGTCVRLDGSGERPVTAPANGIGLWWKETMAMREGDVLCAIGTP